MGHRIVKRVPLDFDAPLKEVYSGYVMPDDVRLTPCPDCDGTGYSPTARWLHDTFYNHNVAGERGGWRDKLVQADVDALIEAGRLRVFAGRSLPTSRHPEGRNFWMADTRTPEEINEAERGRGFIHDGINCWTLVKSRCERLGAPHECARCEGHGDIGTPEQREAYENWTGTEPPEGEGWQLWETTSEGSPITPVFATARQLADYAAVHATIFGSERLSSAQWLASFEAESTDVDSMLVLTLAETQEGRSDG